MQERILSTGDRGADNLDSILRRDESWKSESWRFGDCYQKAAGMKRRLNPAAGLPVAHGSPFFFSLHAISHQVITYKKPLLNASLSSDPSE